LPLGWVPGPFPGFGLACGPEQGLAVGTNRPLIPVTSLEAMASLAGAERVLALLDARMGEVYSGCYQLIDGAYVLGGDIRVSAPSAVALPSEPGWIACGIALAADPVLAERLSAAGIAVHPDILPSAATVARLAAPRAARGEGIDAALAAPLYIRDKVAKTVAERLSEGGRA